MFVPHIGCPCRCSFCNQHEITGQAEAITPEKVHQAVKQAKNRIEKDAQSVEIAFFGGSFTAIEKSYRLALLEAAQREVQAYGLGGIRISTRPDKIDVPILNTLKSYGVTAIELGAQSLCEEVLKANRRGHTAAQVVTAAKLIQSAGFELGLQMMTGLYQDTSEKAMQTAEKIIALKPDTVRIYPTLLFENTYLYELWQKGEYTPQSLEEAVSLCADLIPLFEKNGIRIIRVGLHAEAEMQGKYVAGPFHAAFKELCLSRIFYQRLWAALHEKIVKTGKIKYTVKVNPKMFSVAVGQKKENQRKLREQGFQIGFEQDSAVALGDFKLTVQPMEE